MKLKPAAGIAIAGMANVWPEDLLGPTAYLCDEDVYAAMLGTKWRDALAQRQWDVDRTRNQLGVNGRSWTRGTAVGSVELALAAATNALRNAGLTAADVDCIVAATCTPNHITSSMAGKLAKQLGTAAAAIDIRAGGAGGLNALATAAHYHTAGCRVSLVVAAEASSKYLGDHDLATALLFGDGAAAMVLVSDAAAGAAGLVGAVMGNCDWAGSAFTVPGALPPTNDTNAEDYRFQRPDAVYRECLAQAWTQVGETVRGAFPAEQADIIEVLPYAVTLDQVNRAAAPFGVGGAASIALLAEHGCIGCASPLAAMVMHWQQRREKEGAILGETVASLAVAGGISWAGLLWRT